MLELARGTGENSNLGSSYEESSRVGVFYIGLAESTKSELQKNQTVSLNSFMGALAVYKENDLLILLQGSSPF